MLLIDLIRVIQVNGSVKFNHRQLMRNETNYLKTQLDMHDVFLRQFIIWKLLP